MRTGTAHVQRAGSKMGEVPLTRVDHQPAVFARFVPTWIVVTTRPLELSFDDDRCLEDLSPVLPSDRIIQTNAQPIPNYACKCVKGETGGVLVE